MTYRIDSASYLPAAILARNPGLLDMEADAGTPAKASKYHNKKTEINGTTFDSIREATRYSELVLLQKAGVVSGVELQPRFILQDGYTDSVSLRWIRKLEYVADFRVTYADGHVEVEDVKSVATRTKSYLIKRKLFRKKFSNLLFKEVE
jgi:hypothetical protein